MAQCNIERCGSGSGSGGGNPITPSEIEGSWNFVFISGESSGDLTSSSDKYTSVLIGLINTDGNSVVYYGKVGSHTENVATVTLSDGMMLDFVVNFDDIVSYSLVDGGSTTDIPLQQNVFYWKGYK